jgi:hypothetical protein
MLRGIEQFFEQAENKLKLRISESQREEGRLQDMLLKSQNLSSSLDQEKTILMQSKTQREL